MVPERKWPFLPISALGENFNPRNIQYMPVVRGVTKSSHFRSGATLRIRPLKKHGIRVVPTKQCGSIKSIGYIYTAKTVT